MAINADQAGKIVEAFTRALDVHYGSSVATLAQFRDSRRKTYMQKLEELLDAPKWRKYVADAVQLLGTARGVVTRLENERASKVSEMKARHEAEIAALRDKQAKEVNGVYAHYEPAILEARTNRDEREKELTAKQREAYFTGLGAEDDGRSLYSRNDNVGIDEAIRQRVDAYIESNLGDDPEGQKVLIRIQQTDLVKSLVYFEKSVETMRASFLGFIKSGELPPVTIKAWKIVNGQDISQ